MIFSEYADDVFSRMNTKVSECRFLNQKQYYKSQKLSGRFREENGPEKLFSESFVIYSIFYVQIYIVMCWLLAAPLPILFATPYILEQFDPIVGEWTLNGNFSNNIIFNRINNYTNFVLFGSLILSFIIYALIIGYLIYQVYTNFYKNSSISILYRNSIFITHLISSKFVLQYKWRSYAFWVYLESYGFGGYYRYFPLNSISSL